MEGFAGIGDFEAIFLRLIHRIERPTGSNCIGSLDSRKIELRHILATGVQVKNGVTGLFVNDLHYDIAFIHVIKLGILSLCLSKNSFFQVNGLRQHLVGVQIVVHEKI